MPYTSWTKFLQHHAALGSEEALKVLRSKKIQQALAVDSANEKIAADLNATKISNNRQASILSAPGINRKHKWALLAVVKMHELISKETDANIDDIKYKIDTKGTVIFTLKNGGTIRDTGSELHFSSHDECAKNLAEKYAKAKWGRRVQLSNNIYKLVVDMPKARVISR